MCQAEPDTAGRLSPLTADVVPPRPHTGHSGAVACAPNRPLLLSIPPLGSPWLFAPEEKSITAVDPMREERFGKELVDWRAAERAPFILAKAHLSHWACAGEGILFGHPLGTFLPAMSRGWGEGSGDS